MKPIQQLKRKKLLIISLDGFPFRLIQSVAEAGIMPFLKALFSHRSPEQMRSVFPTISCVAWATFLTGRNPGAHGIYGFIQKSDSGPFFIPDSRSLAAPPVFKKLNAGGIRTVLMNVPVTYPPQRVDGVLVGGFLGVDVKKIAYPPAVGTYLESVGYVIDVDTESGRAENQDVFLSLLQTALDRRCEAFLQLTEQENWQYAHLHIMETDRLFHFFWSDVEKSISDPNRISAFFTHLDAQLEQVISSVEDDVEILLLSDHGFCAAELEFDLNAFLAEQGFIRNLPEADSLQPLDPTRERVFSLIPGRIYISRKLNPGKNIHTLRREIHSALASVTRPDTKEKVFTRLFFKEELYSGANTDSAPDILAVPTDGIELKSGFRRAPLFTKSSLQGMHTYPDAFIWCNNRNIDRNRTEIIDLYPSILDFFDLQDKSAEGVSLFDRRRN